MGEFKRMLSKGEIMNMGIAGTRVARKNVIALTAGALFAVIVALPAPALAVVIFSDDFNRANSDTVGNGWVETVDNNNAADVRIIDNELELGKNQNPRATHSLSTLGLNNILLEYDWRGLGTESPDTLTVFWSPDGSIFSLLATHSLSTPTTFAHNSVGLGLAAENLAAISIRFWLNADQGNDFGRIDNVVVSGDLTNGSVPEPATLALLGIALACVGASRRRKLH